MSIVFSISAQVEGTWRLAQIPGALAVGPTQTDYSWWSSSATDINSRACLFDDSVTFDANGISTLSVTGRASMSALRATTGPGLPPLIIPTTPVWATFSLISIPKDLKWSATYLAVINSLLESSGFWCICLLHLTTLFSTFEERVSIFLYILFACAEERQNSKSIRLKNFIA